jgi:hypothetical protein
LLRSRRVFPSSAARCRSTKGERTVKTGCEPHRPPNNHVLLIAKLDAKQDLAQLHFLKMCLTKHSRQK